MAATVPIVTSCSCMQYTYVTFNFCPCMLHHVWCHSVDGLRYIWIHGTAMSCTLKEI